MNTPRLIKLLFIDPNEDWLEFIVPILKKNYIVEVAQTLDEILPRLEEQIFDLIFISSRLAQESLETLNRLARDFNLHFVVFFPSFPDGEVAKVFFQANMLDVQGKPYDTESLKKVIEEDIAVKKVKEARMASRVTNDYKTRVNRLREYLNMSKRI